MSDFNDGGEQRGQLPFETLFGTAGSGVRAINSYPVWRYLLVLAVVVAGGIYALPNLYPPDHAVQLRPESADASLAPQVIERAGKVLTDAGLQWRGPEVANRTALFRVAGEAQQLRARAALSRAFASGRGENYVVAVNLAPTTPAWLQSVGAHSMNYGLDLSGGVHFLLDVDVDAAIQRNLEASLTNVRRALREDATTEYAGRPMVEDGLLRFAFVAPTNRDAALQRIQDGFPELVAAAVDGGVRPMMTLALNDQSKTELEQYAIAQNIQSLRNRVNLLGVSEPLVQRVGRSRIAIDLPGVQDSAEAKRILGKVANLEFRLVAKPDAPRHDVERYDYEGFDLEVERDIIVTGDCVTNARQGFDPETSAPQVNITLNGPCGQRMNKISARNVGNRMAVIFQETRTVDIYEGDVRVRQESYDTERVISAAVIQDALGNSFRITGLSLGEAGDLADLLRAGALAAPTRIVEERTVGPSLGKANIRSGAISVTAGFTLVMLFMLFYYRLFGLAANIALVVNLVLITAAMSLLGATLTMPGIAGIVLTVGMAVDANVLIFSRIREELLQRTPQQAIHAGFERALVTILDANLTTLFVAVILYAIGTGPVRGFAVTLAIGILTSMFTAIIGTRAIVNLMYGGRNVTGLSIGGAGR